MPAASLEHLDALYESDPDPWGFRTHPYELKRFESIAQALLQPHYAAILELGCGNGELAARLIKRCDCYVGVDAAARAIDEAMQRIPTGHFFRRYLPCPLPTGYFDLIVLSEVLYFLDVDGLCSLATSVSESHPDAEILCVNYLGTCGHALDGNEAFRTFHDALPTRYRYEIVYAGPGFRIDRMTPIKQAKRPCN